VREPKVTRILRITHLSGYDFCSGASRADDLRNYVRDRVFGLRPS
jgi:hypothetical protein